jgi:TatD DNase family protein
VNFIDTHTHLYLKDIDIDIDEEIKNSISLGINEFYLPSIDSSYTNRMMDLKNKYPNEIKLMMGLHPTHIDNDSKIEIDHVKKMLGEVEFSAVGEIGIDLYWNKKNLKNQINIFIQQIEIALSHKLPVVIHCRDAFDEVYKVLLNFKKDNLSGIFHCFTGTKEEAEKIIDLNFKLGIGGVVTFKNGGIDKFLNQIPLTSIVLETDAPYLAPHPHRGKRNKSSYLVIIAEKIAQIYNLPIEKIAQQTTKNARSVFKI